MPTIVRLADTVRVADVLEHPDGSPAPRVLDVRLVGWPSTAEVSDDGHTTYTETWEPGGLAPAAEGTVVPVYAGHTPTARGVEHGPLIGRLGTFTALEDGAYADLILAATPAATEVWELARTVGATVSIEADVEPAAQRHVVRSAAAPAVLTGVAVLLLPNRGAVPGATVLAARNRPNGETMPTATDTLTVTPTEPTEPEPDEPTEPEVRPIARAEVDEMVRRAVVRMRSPQPSEAAHPLAIYRTLADFAEAAYNQPGSLLEAVQGAGEQRPLAGQIARAWVDQITTANPGVIPPAWLSEVFGIVDMGRPVITGIGTRPLPSSGMDLSWPYFDGDLRALVGEQVTQKTDITSVLVSLKKGTTPIRTFAGGSDVSYQLIRRSDPSYRDAYLRIMSASWAMVTDAAASDDLLDKATGYVAFDPATGTPDTFRAAVFTASVDVQAATGSPASVVLAATDVFVKFGSALLPSVYGTQNVTGTADASTLNVSVSGLRVVHAVDLPAGTTLVTNGQAASWLEDGPFVISAPDVRRLGEDTAIWGMAALAVTAPAGVVVLAATAPVAAGARTAKK